MSSVHLKIHWLTGESHKADILLVDTDGQSFGCVYTEPMPPAPQRDPNIPPKSELGEGKVMIYANPQRGINTNIVMSYNDLITALSKAQNISQLCENEELTN